MRTRVFAFIALALTACSSKNSATTDGAVDTKTADTPTVDTPTGAPMTITLTMVNEPLDAATFSFLVAYQDGAGSWTLAPSPTNDVYTFTVTSSAYSVAWTCIPTTLPRRTVNVVSFSVAETTSVTQFVPPECTDRPTVALGGTITSPPVGGAVDVAFGRIATVATAGTVANTLSYALETPKGTHDLVAGHDSLGGGSATSTNVDVDSVFVKRALAVTAAMSQPIDFSTAQTTTTFPVTGVPAGTKITSTASTQLVSAGKTAITLVNIVSAVGAQPFVTRGLAAGQAAAGDIYQQQVSVLDAHGTGTFVSTQNWVATVAAQAYTAPTPLGTVTGTIAATTPYPIIAASWSPYPSAVGYIVGVNQNQTATQCGSANPCTIHWSLTLSPGVVGTSPQAQMPDLSALTGWDAKLQPVAGTIVTGAATGVLSSVGASDFPDFPLPPAGSTRAFVSSGYSVMP